MYKITTSKTNNVFEEVKDTSTIERNINIKVSTKLMKQLRTKFKVNSELSDSVMLSLILKTI